jgi:hypothetical protein
VILDFRFAEAVVVGHNVIVPQISADHESTIDNHKGYWAVD